MRYPGFVPTINLRLPVLSLTLFAHCYPSQTLLWLKIYQKLFSTHMHNWLLLYICRKNTYQSAVIRSISQCLAPKFASLSQPQKPEELCRCSSSSPFILSLASHLMMLIERSIMAMLHVSYKLWIKIVLVWPTCWTASCSTLIVCVCVRAHVAILLGA